jgi:DNA-binding CsgD family transcriptional regulator
MSAGRDLIPDAIEPLSGYRLWAYEINGRLGSLHSMTCRGRPACPWVGREREWVTAGCKLRADPWHVTPSQDCSCGIYAVPAVRDVFGYGDAFESGDGTGYVMGRVELAGRIVVHDFGYRAGKARIVELVPVEGCTRDVRRLANRLGLPIAPAVRSPETPPLEREALRVLQMIASGSTTREVADALKLSQYAVRRNLERALDVLGAGARTRVLGPWLPPAAA